MGPTPEGHRRIIPIVGGTVAGPGLNGRGLSCDIFRYQAKSGLISSIELRNSLLGHYDRHDSSLSTTHRNDSHLARGKYQ
ncbi:DUF3237 family protein [Paenarthrobacter aurescens]|uniref:DUF3237 family protein n=1 Tax=Paenarthrobacter aurescens TaxID=43663 RepID=UPI001EE34DF7|nr:DUF3237 family protein [Paenarthrobacter aurescens]